MVELEQLGASAIDAATVSFLYKPTLATGGMATPVRCVDRTPELDEFAVAGLGQHRDTAEWPNRAV